MHIMIKTAQEFHDAHVTIEVVDGATSSLGDRLYTAAEVGDLQAGEAEPLRRRITELEAELERYRRAHVCTDRCHKNEHVAMVGRKLVADLETKLAESRELVAFKDKIRADIDRDNIKLRSKIRELAAQVKEYDRDRTTERDRADQNKARAERAELQVAELGLKLAKATSGHVCTDRCKPNAHVTVIGRLRLDEAEAALREVARTVDPGLMHMKCTVEGSTVRADDWPRSLASSIRKVREKVSPWADNAEGKTSQA